MPTAALASSAAPATLVPPGTMCASRLEPAIRSLILSSPSSDQSAATRSSATLEATAAKDITRRAATQSLLKSVLTLPLALNALSHRRNVAGKSLEVWLHNSRAGVMLIDPAAEGFPITFSFVTNYTLHS
jgi:hypothetical protein